MRLNVYLRKIKMNLRRLLRELGLILIFEQIQKKIKLKIKIKFLVINSNTFLKLFSIDFHSEINVFEIIQANLKILHKQKL